MRADYVPIFFGVRPLSSDPDDDFVVECALNASACLVTSKLRDLRIAEEALRIPVLTPAQFLHRLEP